MTNLGVIIWVPICGIMVFCGDLSGLDFQTLAQIDDAASDDVFVDYLGPKHATVLWEQSKTLIVTFEHHSDLSAYSSGVPIGWQLAQEKGWSHLCVVSEHQDWFRDPMSSAILIG